MRNGSYYFKFHRHISHLYVKPWTYLCPIPNLELLTIWALVDWKWATFFPSPRLLEAQLIFNVPRPHGVAKAKRVIMCFSRLSVRRLRVLKSLEEKKVLVQMKNGRVVFQLLEVKIALATIHRKLLWLSHSYSRADRRGAYQNYTDYQLLNKPNKI